MGFVNLYIRLFSMTLWKLFILVVFWTLYPQLVFLQMMLIEPVSGTFYIFLQNEQSFFVLRFTLLRIFLSVYNIIIVFDKSSYIRIIDILIWLQSSNWLNFNTFSRPKTSTILVTSVKASMPSTQELPKYVLKIKPDFH